MRDALLAVVFPASVLLFAVLGTAAYLQDSDPGMRNTVTFFFVSWTAELFGLLAVFIRLDRIHREGWSVDDTYSLLAWDALTLPVFLSLSMYVLGFMRTGFPPSDPTAYLRNAAMPIAFALALWVALTLFKREFRSEADVCRSFRLGLPELLRRLESAREPRLRLEKVVRNPLGGRVSRVELSSVLGRVVLVGFSRRVTTARLTSEDWRRLADLLDSVALDGE